MSNAETTGIQGELYALKNDEGLWVPEDILVWARHHPRSALHQRLEWDDAKAGHEHRLWQVRQLVAIHCVKSEGSGARQLVSLSIDRIRPGGGYRDIDDVLPVRELRAVLLGRCAQRAGSRSFKIRTHHRTRRSVARG